MVNFKGDRVFFCPRKMDHGKAALVALQGICPPKMAEQT